MTKDKFVEIIKQELENLKNQTSNIDIEIYKLKVQLNAAQIKYNKFNERWEHRDSVPSLSNIVDRHKRDDAAREIKSLNEQIASLESQKNEEHTYPKLNDEQIARIVSYAEYARITANIYVEAKKYIVIQIQSVIDELPKVKEELDSKVQRIVDVSEKIISLNDKINSCTDETEKEKLNEKCRRLEAEVKELQPAIEELNKKMEELKGKSEKLLNMEYDDVKSDLLKNVEHIQDFIKYDNELNERKVINLYYLPIINNIQMVNRMATLLDNCRWSNYVCHDVYQLPYHFGLFDTRLEYHGNYTGPSALKEVKDKTYISHITTYIDLLTYYLDNKNIITYNGGSDWSSVPGIPQSFSVSNYEFTDPIPIYNALEELSLLIDKERNKLDKLFDSLPPKQAFFDYERLRRKDIINLLETNPKLVLDYAKDFSAKYTSIMNESFKENFSKVINKITNFINNPHYLDAYYIKMDIDNLPGWYKDVFTGCKNLEDELASEPCKSIMYSLSEPHHYHYQEIYWLPINYYDSTTSAKWRFFDDFKNTEQTIDKYKEIVKNGVEEIESAKKGIFDERLSDFKEIISLAGLNMEPTEENFKKLIISLQDVNFFKVEQIANDMRNGTDKTEEPVVAQIYDKIKADAKADARAEMVLTPTPASQSWEMKKRLEEVYNEVYNNSKPMKIEESSGMSR